MSESNDHVTPTFPCLTRPPFPQHQPRFGSSGVDPPASQSVSSSTAQQSPSGYELRDVQQQMLSSSIAAAMIDAQFQHQHHHLPHQHLQVQLAARLHQRFAAAAGAGIPFHQQVAACGLLRASSTAPTGLSGSPGSSGPVAAAAGVVSAGHLLSYLYARQQQQHRSGNHQEHGNSRAAAAHSGITPAFLGGPGTGCHQLDEPKPTHSYIGIIAMAILGSKDRKLVLSDIYQWILDHYPYFRRRGPGWRNSIRHNLSLNDCFVKVGRSANGKGHYWAVHPANVDDFERGDFRRRRAQRKVRRAMGLSVPDDDEDSPISSPSVPVDHGGPPSVAATWPTSMFDCAPTSHGDDNNTHRWKQRRFAEGKNDVLFTSTKVVSNDLPSPIPVSFTESVNNGGRKRRLFDVESLLAPDVIDCKRKSPKGEIFFLENAIYQRDNELDQRHVNVVPNFTTKRSTHPDVADRPSSFSSSRSSSSQDETGHSITASPPPRRSDVSVSDVVEQTKLIDDESAEINVEGETVEGDSLDNAGTAISELGRMTEIGRQQQLYSIATNAARIRIKATSSDVTAIDLVTSPADRNQRPVFSSSLQRDDVESKYEQYCRSRNQQHEILMRNHHSMAAAAAWIAHLKGSFLDPRTLLFPTHVPTQQSSTPVDEPLPLRGHRDERRSDSSVDDVITADRVVALGTDRMASFTDQRSSVSIKTETV